MQIFSKDWVLPIFRVFLINLLKDLISSFLNHPIRIYQITMASLHNFLNICLGLSLLLALLNVSVVLSTSSIPLHAVPLLTRNCITVFWDIAYLSRSYHTCCTRTFSSRSFTLFRTGISIIWVIVNNGDSVLLFKVGKYMAGMRLVLLHRWCSHQYFINHNLSLLLIRNFDYSLNDIVAKLISHEILQIDCIHIIRRTAHHINLSIRLDLRIIGSWNTNLQYFIDNFFLLLFITMN